MTAATAAKPKAGQWTEAELAQFRKDGYILKRNLVSPKLLATLNTEMPRLLDGKDEVDHLHRERERTGAVRQVYLAHRHSAPFKELVSTPQFLAPVKQLASNDVYIYHSKINVKDAFEGTVWLWHTDYGYWINDGVDPKMVSIMLLLDKATLHNGCLLVVPGSHLWRPRLAHHADTETTSYRQWCVIVDELKKHLKEEAIVPITGEPGDALFFDCDLLHASGHNLSPLPRKTFIAVYNDMSNQPRPVDNPRADWVVARVFDPL